MNKLVLLLLGFTAFVALLEARSVAKRQIYKTSQSWKGLTKRQTTIDRDELVQALNDLTAEEFASLDDDEKIAVAFLIYIYDIQPSEIHNPLFHNKKRSLTKRDAEDEWTREDFVAMLNGLTLEDIEKMTDDEKLGLLFLIYLFEVEPHEIEKRSVLLDSVSKRSLTKRDEDVLTREEFIQFLRSLTPEDVEKLSDEEKLGLLFLIYLFEVEPHELEKREYLM